MSTKIERFFPISKTYTIDVPGNAGDKLSQLSLPLHVAVLATKPEKTRIITGTRFCFLGEYEGRYIELKTIVDRLKDPGDAEAAKLREGDYQALRKKPPTKPFDCWDKFGKLVSIPTGIFVDALIYDSVQEWDKIQLKHWSDISVTIANTRLLLQPESSSRFMNPKTHHFTLYFAPVLDKPIGGVTIEDLNAALTEALKHESFQGIQYKCKVISWKVARHDNTLVMTGVDFLNFYSTWMQFDQYEKLWTSFGRQELRRPWPSEDQANKIEAEAKKPHKDMSGPGKDTTAKLFHVKAIHAIGGVGKLKKPTDVMGIGAPDIADKWWGQKYFSAEEAEAEADKKDTKKPAAEWLHRNAFCFGGLGEDVDLNSSQARENLIFGTRETNSHMIRAENTINSLLKTDTPKPPGTPNFGTLVTKNIVEGKAYNHDSRSSVGYKGEDIPAWAKNKPRMWLSFVLKYIWTMPPNSMKSDFNAEILFHPFSRYIPFLLEAHLDDILLRKVLQNKLQTPETPPLFNNGGSGLTSPDFSAHNSYMMAPLSYYEPTILWNAAQHHLPYVQVGTSKIISPAVAESPAGQDESNEEPVVEVIGADPLFSNEAQDKPVEAVRVVHLNLASKHRQARSLQSSAPAYLQAQNALLGPILAVPALDVPQEGFVVVGTVELFGVPGLSSKFEKWEGPAPSNVIVLPNKPVCIKRVTLAKDFHLSTVISELEGTAFDTITLRNVSVYHQNYQCDTTKAVGWHFNADLVVDESCGALREVLSKALGVSEPTLSVYLFLGADGGWNRPPSLHSFTLEGVFAGLAVKPIKGVVISKIGVRVFGIRTMKYDPKPRSALDYGFSVFGSMNLDVPGSVVPLSLEYEIREFDGTLCLGASIDFWKNPLGANGLLLSGVSFTTSFALSSPWRSLTFDVSANLLYEDVSATFQGTFSPSGPFELQASIHDVTVKTIDTLFRRISGGDLALPDVDVSIGAASLTISNNGFSIALDRVTIGDYTSFDAGLAITSHNVTLRGKLTTDVIQFGDVEVKEAFLQVTFEKKGGGKNTDLIVGGKVAFSTLTFEAAVHLYKSPDRSARSLEWTALAALTTGNDALALSKVVPELQGTPFDLALTQVVFVAASRDDPDLGNMISSGFTFHQGVQVCAVLGQIDALNSAMRGPVPGLTISAGWSKAKGFNLQVHMPTPTPLNLGNGITTTPFTLSIATKPSVQLILSAGLNVPVAHSPKPLQFTVSLGVGLMGADLSVQESGWWVNPLGISPNVKVGPNLGFSTSIIYAQFLTTGLPSGFAIQGGLKIGKTPAQLALKIDEDPMKVLLSAEIESLNIKDVVDFASAIIDDRIPDPPRDLLDFKKIKLYISPAGAYIGTTFYPQGFSFKADVILFGKRADIECIVETSKITLKGGVDNFVLGPLTVRGTTGPRAIIDCELGLEKQHLFIDGFISLFGLESTAHIAIDILPTPKFDWFTHLKFTDILAFQLRATLVGSTSIKDLSTADFVFDALFEQHILQYIHDQLTCQFAQARRAAQGGIDAAQKDVDEAEAAWEKGVNKAQATLDEAKKAWDAKKDSVTTESNKIINDFNRGIERLQNNITYAQKDYDTVMTDAQTVVSVAERGRAQALQSARHNVDNAKREMVNLRNAAQRDVDNTEREFNAAFGVAHDAIESARRDVQSIQNQIDDVFDTIHEYQDASWRQLWKKGALGPLYGTIGALTTSKLVADGALRGAQAMVTTTKFIGKKTAFDGAKAALIVANEVGQAGLDVANVGFATADETTHLALVGANAALEATKFGVEWVALQAAKEAFQVFKEANSEAFHAATQALVDLLQCAEYLAYKVAAAGLDFARATTVTLKVARHALEVARELGDDALAIGQWIVEHLLDAFDIRVVHLSGSLRGMLGADGSMAKPFTAHIEGVVAGKPFALDGEFDLSKTADFITLIFKHLCSEIKKVV